MDKVAGDARTSSRVAPPPKVRIDRTAPRQSVREPFFPADPRGIVPPPAGRAAKDARFLLRISRLRDFPQPNFAQSDNGMTADAMCTIDRMSEAVSAGETRGHEQAGMRQPWCEFPGSQKRELNCPGASKPGIFQQATARTRPAKRYRRDVGAPVRPGRAARGRRYSTNRRSSTKSAPLLTSSRTKVTAVTSVAKSESGMTTWSKRSSKGTGLR